MKQIKLKKIHYITDFKKGSSCEWADISVELEDGKLYAFTVETLGMIKLNMKEEKKHHFYEQDLLIVDKMEKKYIEKAIKEMLKNDNISKYGILQKRPHKKTKVI